MTKAMAPVAAFLLASALGAAGLFAGYRDLVTPEFTPLAIAIVGYLLVASLVIGTVSEHLPAALLGLWILAVALCLAVFLGSDSTRGWLAIPASLILGSVAFGAWAASGAIFLVLGRKLP